MRKEREDRMAGREASEGAGAASAERAWRQSRAWGRREVRAGAARTSGVGEHLHAAAEHGFEHGVLSRERAERGVVQRAAHVQLHVLAVRGQGLQRAGGGAGLRPRRLRGFQGRGRRRRRGVGGLGRHAGWRAAGVDRSRLSLHPSACSRRPRTPDLGPDPLANTPTRRRYSATPALHPMALVPPGSRRPANRWRA